MEVHIRDSNIFSNKYPDRPNPFFKWVYDRLPVSSNITVFTDNYTKEALKSSSKYKVAWLLEPPSIAKPAYDFVKANINVFDCVFTFIEGLLDFPNTIWVPYGTSWIHKEQRKIYSKTKQISIVASEKRQTDGHKLRHEIIKFYGSQIAAMGRGYRAIDQKIEAHRDYRYSIVVENGRFNNYFSEKLLDCFMTGSVPIYWGFSNIGKFFDVRGIITFEKVEDLEIILKKISEEDYKKRLPAIEANFRQAHSFLQFESFMYEGFLKQLDC